MRLGVALGIAVAVAVSTCGCAATSGTADPVNRAACNAAVPPITAVAKVINGVRNRTATLGDEAHTLKLAAAALATAAAKAETRQLASALNKMSSSAARLRVDLLAVTYDRYAGDEKAYLAAFHPVSHICVRVNGRRTPSSAPG